jgi:hypothetical protein
MRKPLEFKSDGEGNITVRYDDGPGEGWGSVGQLKPIGGNYEFWPSLTTLNKDDLREILDKIEELER